MIRPRLGVPVVVAVMLAGCAVASDGPEESLEQELSTGKASVKLTGASASIAQTSDTVWTLDKTGEVDASTSTVTWDITAVRGTTVAGHLVINGFMNVTNDGSAPASIGNIVVNLQTKAGAKWITRSSDVANGTDGDDATSAQVVAHATSEGLSTFTENGASGQLAFMDATTNTVFSLVPEALVAPGSTISLLFSASFDNNVLALPVGKALRAEVIVSFGNSGGNNNNSAPNIDIDGSGTVDADEARVRSVPARLGLTVPSTQQGNTAVTLSDTIDDIVTTGTVTFDNAVFQLGSTTGTVTVSYDGGADGGTITNCAQLTGSSSTTASVGGFSFPVVTGLDLEACDTLTIEGEVCAPGTCCGEFCGWESGDFVTYTQGFWSDDAAAITLLTSNYSGVFASTGGVLQVGIPGAAGFDALFTGVLELMAYLPDVGAIGPLTADLVDPSTTASGAFGGNVVALTLNVAFSDAGATPGGAGLRFGDLTLCSVDTLPALNGQPVRDVLALANTLLGGGSGVYSIAQVDPIAQQLNGSFGSGNPSAFAQDHLVPGACPP